MIYIMKANNTKNTKNAFLIFVTIPRETFVAASEDEDFFLYNSSGIFAYSHNTEEFQKHCQQIYEKLSVSKSAFYYGKAQNTSGGYLLVTGITPFQWLMASIYPSYISYRDTADLLHRSIPYDRPVSVHQLSPG